MQMPVTPPQLLELYNSLQLDDPQVVHKKMFGFPASFVNGNMFAGLHGDQFIVRLSPDDRATLTSQHGASTFEPMPGRPMKEYIVLPSQIVNDHEQASHWLKQALSFVSAMPAKQKKPRK